MEEVIHALSVKCHHYLGIFTFKDSLILSPLIPFLTPEHLTRGTNVGYALFDCTWPKDWHPEAIPKKVSFNTLWPKEIQARVLKNWGDYGYK